jgi:hypothetical protein
MAPLIKIAAFLGLSLLVAGQGTQFITGACTADADCASKCCGFTSGKCAAPIPAQERGEGCGFGDAQPNDPTGLGLGTPASVQPAAAPAPVPAASEPSVAAVPAPAPATTPGTQFITGACTADTDCASACCGFTSGKCAAPIPAQERGEGCGFGDAQPNDPTGLGLGTPASVQPAAAPVPAASEPSVAAVPASAPATTPGTQFITGACTSDADCALGCCGFNSGKCAGPVVAQDRDGGCGFGDAQPNDNAVQALKGQRLGKRGVVYWM